MGMLAEEILGKYRRAGQIASRVREEMRRKTKEGMPLLEICEKTEQLIASMGGRPAFPCNVSINEVAAHYTSPPNDSNTVPEDSLVKIDIGVHVDGYIADTAVTVCFAPELEDMVQASEAALETAIKTIRPGIHTSDLGSEIQRTIERHGFKPISNLTGHQIGRYMIHTGKSLPNVKHVSFSRIQAGDVCAIEPFVTVKDAAGVVEEGPQSYIFRFVKRKPVREPEARHLMTHIEEEYRTLPFAERWLKSYGQTHEHKMAFTNLLASKCIIAYPVFIEVSRKPVAQSEHTVYVGVDSAIVLT
jgi:methionyl aminopeptidase